MATRYIAGGLQDLGDLAADQGHLAGRLVIGLDRKQADKPHLSKGAAIGSKSLNTNIVQIGGAVHARAQIGLGNRQGFARFKVAAHLSRQNRRLIGPP